MKLNRIALAAAAAIVATAAQAAPSVDINNAATVKVYLSGASALRAAIAGVVLNDVCGGTATNATTTLYNVAESGTGFSFSSTNGNFWAITCRLPVAKFGLAVNTPVAFLKSDNGGSAQGVFPVFYGTARPFVDAAPASCATTTTADRAYSACSANTLAVPQFGVSDVEPGLFKGVNVPNDPLDTSDDNYPVDGLSTSELSQMVRTPILQTVFGVAVNDALYAGMFAKQGLATKFSSTGAACTTASTDENCTPTIGYAEARTFFLGNASNWRLLVASTDSKINTQVNICRRVQGSGTQAAANAVLLNLPCSPTAAAPADFSASDTGFAEAMSPLTGKTESGLTVAQYLDANMGGTGATTMPAGTKFVFEGSGTGDVVSCLKRANTGGGYAIGHVSKENAPGSNNWRHVRLEGAAASRDNLIVGRYDYAVESTMQYKTSYYNTLSASQKSFITNFIAEMKKPDALAKLSSANQAGVAALPSSYSGSFDARTGNAAIFGSRVTRSGNTCNAFTAQK